jgi:hypothetical protein
MIRKTHFRISTSVSAFRFGNVKSTQNNFVLENNQTLCGEIVYLKHLLEFKDKKKETKRDTVLEENLLDVKRLLKNSAISQANK